MSTHTLLSPEHDPMGAAALEYLTTGTAQRLRVFSTQFDEDEMPVATLFRQYPQMSPIEQTAIQHTHGNTLDVGAGAGCHALELQTRNIPVTAIDISPLCVQTMKQRGVVNAQQIDFFSPQLTSTYQTILFLMNGAGIMGRISRMPAFFKQLGQLLAPNGQALMDSTDLSYIFLNEDGTMDLDLNNGYYGEVDFTLQYRNIKGRRFNWVYIDFDTLAHHASLNGFHAECLLHGPHYDYLARITRL